MNNFLMCLIMGLVAIVLSLLVFAIVHKDLYDKLNAVFAINTYIVLLIMIVGFYDGRADMYIDIAISYALLGFVTTVILAKFIGGHK